MSCFIVQFGHEPVASIVQFNHEQVCTDSLRLICSFKNEIPHLFSSFINKMLYLFSLSKNKMLCLFILVMNKIYRFCLFTNKGALLIQFVHKLDASFVQKQDVSVHSRMRCLICSVCTKTRCLIRSVHSQTRWTISFSLRMRCFIHSFNEILQSFSKCEENFSFTALHWQSFRWLDLD